jgi:PLP dependent protein
MSYLSVIERVASAAMRSGRDQSEITVVAVSKTKSESEIMEAYDLGHRDFGENRADEMAAKASSLPRDIRWHFVGALQSNKARLVRGHTYLLHSMDRVSLAKAWLKGSGLPPPVLVQVNLADEPQKSGVKAGEASSLVESLLNIGIEVKGVMTIPPAPDNPDSSREFFASLREIRDGLAAEFPGVRELSMGMTDDFEVAIEEGASIIRIGRAIFGARR